MANNDLNTNPLYNNIATAAQEVKSAYTGLPTFKSNMQASLVGPDAGLNSALGGYTDKVAELFAHDNEIAKNWSTSQVPSTIQPEGFMEDPYAKAMASSALYAQKGKETASALNLYETRKNYLGDLVDKAVKVYEAGIKGKEIDYQAAKDEFANSLKLMDLAETKRHNLATETDTGGYNVYSLDGLSPEKVTLMKDEDAVAWAKRIYGEAAITGGSLKAQGANAKLLVKNFVQGKVDESVVSKSLGTSAKEAEDLKKFLRDAEKLTAWLSENPEATKTKLSGITTSSRTGLGTGLYNALTGNSMNSQMQSLLGQFKAEKIKDFYGSAFTTTEMKNAGWIPSANKSEYDNLNSINAMIESAKEKIRSLYGTKVSPEVADKILSNLGLDSDSWSDTGVTQER